MPLVTSTEMFKKAYDGGYAIGAFNVNNMEIIQGITEAASELQRPPDPAGVQGRPRLCQPHLSDEAGGGRHRSKTGLPICPASGPRRQLRAVQELHRRRLYLRHDRRLLQAL